MITKVKLNDEQTAYKLGYDNPSLVYRDVFTAPHVVVVNAFYCGQGDAQNQAPIASVYDPNNYDLPTCERKMVEPEQEHIGSVAMGGATERPADVTMLETALTKINAIRNSIIGCQTINWSEHIYPLVAALEEAGIEGAGYPASRANVGTMLERTLSAENEAEVLRQAVEFYANPKNYIDSPSWDGDPGCFTPAAIPVTDDGDGSRPCDCGDTARAALKALTTPTPKEESK